MGRGCVAAGFNDAHICPECHKTGRRAVQLKPPFSVDAISTNDEDEPDLECRFFLSGIPTLEEAVTKVTKLASVAPDNMIDWLYVASDANGERAYAEYALDVVRSY